MCVSPLFRSIRQYSSCIIFHSLRSSTLASPFSTRFALDLCDRSSHTRSSPQNPLLIVVQYIESPLIELSFFTKVIQILSYTILATAFLLFSDGISRTTKSRRAFYLPKIALMTVYFALSVAFELLNVPSMVGIDRSPILATYNWSKPLKHLNFGIGVALLIVSCWIGVYFFTNVYNTQKVLDELPYLEYRYQHLSYRFFILHSTR